MCIYTYVYVMCIYIYVWKWCVTPITIYINRDHDDLAEYLGDSLFSDKPISNDTEQDRWSDL